MFSRRYNPCMNSRHGILDRVTIPIRCDADWSAMPGTDRVRHCAQCGKHVYNLSAMSRREAERLIESTGGRLCARIYQRPDGSILTQNCPQGIRELSRRLARRVSWAMSAVLGLPPVAAQQISQAGIAVSMIARTNADAAAVSGLIFDVTGTPLRGATIEFLQAKSVKAQVRSGSDGRYRLRTLTPGTYEVRITAPGFHSETKPLALSAEKVAQLNAALTIASLMGE